MGVACADAFEQFQAAQFRHLQVGQDYLHGVPLKLFQSLLSGCYRARTQPRLHRYIAAKIPG
jgi:hypothetical protein